MTISSRLNVLVTGGAGYIGSHAVIALLEAGYGVTVIDNLSTGTRQAVSPDAEFCQGDIGDRQLVNHLIRTSGIGAIMHFAGSIIVPESVSDPLKYYRNNTANSLALLECAIATGIRHFVFSSTAAVYGNPLSIPVTEDAPTQPINPYGASKLMTEMMLHDAARAHPINTCALRYFNVAAADPQGRSGQSTASATHLIKVAVEVALGKRSDIAVYGTDYATADGTGVRDYIHVSDLADAHVLILERMLTGPLPSPVFNCGYGRGYSVLDVLDAVERVVGVTMTRRFEPRRMGDPPALIADISRLQAVVNWQPRFPELDTIIAHALSWEEKAIR
jgi:UDP-glucose 4-epimerase